MRTRVFTVTPETWEEHRRAGIAAINDPAAWPNPTPQILATRQKVLTELAGIRPHDKLFFYVQREKQILGGFEAISKPYFDPSAVFPGATHVNNFFPFRVRFTQTENFSIPLHVNQIWAGRDVGKFWTMQQARGDSVGRHACWGLARNEGLLLTQMLQEVNIVVQKLPRPRSRSAGPILPVDFSQEGVRQPHLRYESTLSHLILDGLADGKWKDIFGEYDDFFPFVSTSEGKEMDILLMKHDERNTVIWYQILELKADRFKHENLLQLLSYETWLTSSQAEGNPRSVHMTGIASRFDQDVIDQVRTRASLKQKNVQLIQYTFDSGKQILNISKLQQ